MAEAAAKGEGAAEAEAEAAAGWKMTAVVGARGRWVWLFQARVWGGTGGRVVPGLGWAATAEEWGYGVSRFKGVASGRGLKR